jgi:YD repeat-containing protein
MSEYAEMYPSYILISTTPGHKSSFSGRVSQWTLYDYNEAATHEYKFNYDFAGRLTDSDHTLRLSNGTVREGLFSENDIYYDENGNAYYLQRYSDGDLAEDYIFWYAGNKPVSVRNTGTDNPGTYTYDYDSNGNMIIDGRKSLKLEYNHLNLVDEVADAADTTDESHLPLAFRRYESGGNRL